MWYLCFQFAFRLLEYTYINISEQQWIFYIVSYTIICVINLADVMFVSFLYCREKVGKGNHHDDIFVIVYSLTR